MNQKKTKCAEVRYWNEKLQLYSDYESQKGIYSQHIGYVNLFPLLFGLIPVDSERLLSLFQIMERQTKLNSPYCFSFLNIVYVSLVFIL